MKELRHFTLSMSAPATSEKPISQTLETHCEKPHKVFHHVTLYTALGVHIYNIYVCIDILVIEISNFQSSNRKVPYILLLWADIHLPWTRGQALISKDVLYIYYIYMYIYIYTLYLHVYIHMEI